VVNVNKTNYIIFHKRGKKIDPNCPDVVLNSNEIEAPFTDPSLINKLERIHDNHVVEKMRSFKLLGIFLDEHLSFSKHITHVYAKLSRSNLGLRRVANFAPPNILKTLYYSMIHSHLLYCPTILICAPKASLDRISLLQKKAIRIITKSKSSAYTLSC
jgi:hypothetical protein